LEDKKFMSEKKVVLITGVSSGFGRAIARELSKNHYQVYGTIRRPCEPIEGVSFLEMDVTNQLSIKPAIAELLAREQRIDILINNAGIGIAGPIELTEYSDILHQFEVNFFGMVQVIKEVLPIMRNQKSGTILNINSIGGLIGLPFQGFYSASKFAMQGFSEALSYEVRDHKINVITIHPGDFNTRFTQNRKISGNQTQIQKFYPVFFNKTLPRIESDEQHGLKPEYLAKKILSILKKKSPRSQYIIAIPLQRMSVFLRRVLPDRVFRKIIYRYYTH